MHGPAVLVVCQSTGLIGPFLHRPLCSGRIVEFAEKPKGDALKAMQVGSPLLLSRAGVRRRRACRRRRRRQPRHTMCLLPSKGLL